LNVFLFHKALHMVMVMSTAGWRGKWKASRGSSYGVTYCLLPFNLLFFSTERWLLCTSALIFVSLHVLPAKGLVSGRNEPFYFSSRGRDTHISCRIFIIFSHHGTFILPACFTLALLMPWVFRACLKSPTLLSWLFIISLACMAGSMVVRSQQLIYSKLSLYYLSRDVIYEYWVGGVFS